MLGDGDVKCGEVESQAGSPANQIWLRVVVFM
jgi:hypothetical protein